LVLVLLLVLVMPSFSLLLPVLLGLSRMLKLLPLVFLVIVLLLPP
jgi:hypothetical protein